MATNKIKKGDTVKVITGKDKGKEGKVLEVVKGKVITGKDGKKVRYAKVNGKEAEAIK